MDKEPYDTFFGIRVRKPVTRTDRVMDRFAMICLLVSLPIFIIAIIKTATG